MPLSVITWTTPTTRPSCLTGIIIAALVPAGPGFGDPLDRPFAVDVVELPAHLLRALDDVVEEQRRAAHDHAALHAPSRPVQRERRQAGRVDHVALDPRVLAADEIVALVVARDDEPVVLNDLLQELVKALVDAFRLERLAQLPSRIQQELRDLGLAREPSPVHDRTVDDKGTRRASGCLAVIEGHGRSQRKRRQAGRSPPWVLA